MSKHYILNGHDVVPCDLITWAKFFEKSNRVVAKTKVGDSDVSTVFLGLDHRYGDEGPPMVFETMIFGGPLADYQKRCSTWAEAEAMHAEAVHRATYAHDAQMGAAVAP